MNPTTERTVPERGPDPRLIEAVYAFLHHALLERGLAQDTIDAYRRDLERFTEFSSGQRVKSVAAIRRNLEGLDHENVPRMTGGEAPRTEKGAPESTPAKTAALVRSRQPRGVPKGIFFTTKSTI